MLDTTIPCPECQALLKISNFSGGARIKCPKCSAIFYVPEERVQPAPSPSPWVTAGAPAPVDDYEEDRADEPRPRRPALRRLRKKGKGLVVGLIVGGVLLLLGLGAIAAWVWPGFLLSANALKGEGTEELWGFVPADSNLFAGMDYTSLRTRPDLLERYQKNLNLLLVTVPLLPPVVVDVLKDFEKLVVAGTIPTDGDWSRLSGIVVLQTKNPYNAETIGQALKGASPQRVNGNVYYDLTGLIGQLVPKAIWDQLPKKTLYLCMPSARVLVLAYIRPDQLGAIMSGAGKPAQLSGDKLALMRQGDKSMAWAAFRIDRFLSQQIQRLRADHLQHSPELLPALPAIHKVETFWLRLDLLDNHKYRMAVGVTCDSEASAGQLAAACRNFWNSERVQLTVNKTRDLFRVVNKMPAMNAYLDEILGSIAFSAQGSSATVTMEFSEKTMNQFQDEAEAQVKQGGNPFGFK